MFHCTHYIRTFSSLGYNCFTYKKITLEFDCYKSHYYAAYECTLSFTYDYLFFLISTPVGTVFCCTYSWLFFIYLYVLHCKQAIGNSVMTVGYVMKPSCEEDFAKVSPIWINVGIFSGGKKQELKLCESPLIWYHINTWS